MKPEIPTLDELARKNAEFDAAKRTETGKKGLALLREPFPENQISELKKFQNGPVLKYVGHAALTDRLLDADPNWNWEPMAPDPYGLPLLDDVGGMWIRLTVCGVTRLGYGHAGTKKGGDAIKEIIGDALRNAAMRFGAALALWHKGELHQSEEPALVESDEPEKPIDKEALILEAIKDFAKKFPELTKELQALPADKKLTQADKEFIFGGSETDKERCDLVTGLIRARKEIKEETKP